MLTLIPHPQAGDPLLTPRLVPQLLNPITILEVTEVNLQGRAFFPIASNYHLTSIIYTTIIYTFLRYSWRLMEKKNLSLEQYKLPLAFQERAVFATKEKKINN